MRLAWSLGLVATAAAGVAAAPAPPATTPTAVPSVDELDADPPTRHAREVATATLEPTAAPAVEATTIEHLAEPGQTRAGLLYVEALGKGGLYGVGYERAITPRLALGVAGSFAVVRDQRLLTLAPYVHATVVHGRRHALFTELGATIVHSRIPSPVDSWDGVTDTGGGGFASLGWERAGDRVVVRAAASIVVGEGGLAPWVGLAFGVRP